ncbi:fasciclin domain-containing protein [Sphingomonas floccifaciens]|uniref:Fasciclin domain-containing protein n=1 Tax=Sphingomonas floccifaciens TaxID=1844115 RepID=A0ABW4N9A7_9SPHN
MTKTLMRGLMAGAALAMAASPLAAAQKNPMVGGVAMSANKTIVANASAAPNLTTLVAAVKAAGLVETLSGPGPFTVFAPTNAAFAKLPAGTVDTLVKPENKAQLTGILTYHVVPGRITAQDIAKKAAANGGTATYTTVAGGELRFMKRGNGWHVMDAKGGHAAITTANVMQSNGVVHVIDSVLMP